MAKVPVYEITLSINDRNYTFLSLEDPKEWNTYGWYDHTKPAGWLELDTEEPTNEGGSDE